MRLAGVPRCVIMRILPCLLFTHAVIFTVYAARRKRVSASPAVANVTRIKCMMLRSAASRTRVAGCPSFIGSSFSDAEFASVSPDAQLKLRNTGLQERASDLSNNASVNIFANHMRMWKLVSAGHVPVLILEDDAVLPDDIDSVLDALLARLDGVSNYLVKLHDRAIGASYEWPMAYRIAGRRVRRCACRPHYTSASNAAYLLDPTAARVLIKAALPMRMHSDVFVHEMGCILHKINLYSFHPNLVKTSDRPSTHMNYFTIQRLYLLAVEWLENMLRGECNPLLFAD